MHVSLYEADSQVSYVSLEMSLIPVTSDSDLLVYGVPVLIIMKGYHCEFYQMIDLSVDLEEGKYPLFDLHNKHGPVVFQLYAAYHGCNFTSAKCGIADVGYKAFITSAQKSGEILNAKSLPEAL